ncbi:MAG: hypothetical protein A2097_12570 [Desulfobacula sp. GWF2_41_7]|nr:MAG: hypothetical protein A2097_12570 [Desulfobacula sp. GWF2_41_7]
MITLIQVPRHAAGLMNRVPKKIRRIILIEWLKKDGEPVDDGEPVVVLNTVKASIEMVSEASGHTFHLLKVGDRVVVGDILGVVADNRAEFLEYKKHNLNNLV